MATAASTLTDDTVYPTSDGKPMAETDVHRDQMFDAIKTLDGHFADRPDVYVTGNLMVYFEKGDGRRHRSPDVMVVFGVPKKRRDLYKTWEEDRFPDFVLEITSRSTQSEDTDEKYLVYRDIWKVKEYFLFDPVEEYLEPSLQDYRLVDGEYQPVPRQHGQLVSEVLGLRLDREGLRLVFREPGGGRVILRPDEARARRAELALELAQTKARFADDARDSAEMERDYEKAERERAEAVAERERGARVEAEAEVAKLRAELDALRRNPPG